MVGVALGSIKLSLADFDALTPTEFNHIYRAFERTCIQEDWERVRFLSTAILSPWTKKSMKATDVVRFPWDGHRKGHKAQKVDRETAKRRFEQIIKTLNNEQHIHSDDKEHSVEATK